MTNDELKDVGMDSLDYICNMLNISSYNTHKYKYQFHVTTCTATNSGFIFITSNGYYAYIYMSCSYSNSLIHCSYLTNKECIELSSYLFKKHRINKICTILN